MKVTKSCCFVNKLQRCALVMVFRVLVLYFCAQKNMCYLLALNDEHSVCAFTVHLCILHNTGYSMKIIRQGKFPCLNFIIKLEILGILSKLIHFLEWMV